MKEALFRQSETGCSPFLAPCISLVQKQSQKNDMTRRGTAVKSIFAASDFHVIEFRRYTIKDGESENFARYFESYFPEAFQQLGAIAFGQFYERSHPTGFTWIRGFKDIDARAVLNGAFYYGPLWKEHAAKMNELMTDSDNVLLLQPLRPERGIPVLPSVDPVREAEGAQGIVVAQLFPVKENCAEEFAERAEPIFAKYRAAGAREAGILITLDVPNNFPKLPVRSDGSYLVWLGVLKNDQVLQMQLQPLVEKSMRTFTATGLLRGDPEFITLDPTPRSRLRWMAE